MVLHRLSTSAIMIMNGKPFCEEKYNYTQWSYLISIYALLLFTATIVMDVLNYSLSIFVTNLLHLAKRLQYLFDGRMGSSARFPSKDIKNMQYDLYGPI